MPQFAVMGNPIAHSLSPFIHARFAEQFGIELTYEKIQVDENKFAECVQQFFLQGGQGLNITLPFKQRAFDMADMHTKRCKKARSANTMWTEHNQLYTDNTDGIGLIRDLAHYLELADKSILILGAGGAARGIIPSLLESKVKQVTVANRTIEKAYQLQAEIPELICCSFNQLKEPYDLIINATSASLAGRPLELSDSILKLHTVCYDLAYNKTGCTPFVQWAHTKHCVAVDGLGMLVEQAAESFLIWHQVRPNAATVLAELRKKLANFVSRC